MQLSLALLWLSLALIAVGCGQSERNQPPTNEEQRGAWPPIPEQCLGIQTAYLEEDCLQALHVACRARTTEQDCAAQGKAMVGDYEMSCSWVPVVTYDSTDSCAVESVSYRCEAWMDPAQLLVPCRDPCEFEPDLYSAWNAIPMEREMLKICGPPVGPWLVAGQVSENWEGYSFTCLDNGAPAPPPLCDCSATACAAVAAASNE